MTGWKGLPAVVLEEAGVTVAESCHIRIPYRRPDGTVHRVRYIAPNGRRWWGPGAGLIPFGLDTLPTTRVIRDRSVLFIAEGETDTLALREHAAAIDYSDGRVLDAFAVGLPGALSWQDAWADLLAGFRKVYVVGDGDQAGHAMNARVRASIPRARPLDLRDGDDARSLLQRPGGNAELGRLISRADHLARLVEAFRRFDRLEDAEAWLTGRQPRVREKVTRRAA